MSVARRLKERFFRGAKGDYERCRNGAHQSSGALLCRIPKPGELVALFKFRITM